jgi:membrane protein DedA with SNARE-associated domain
MLDTLTQWIQDGSTSQWFYLVIFTIALLDSVVPVVPSETTVILGGIAAGQGNLWLVLVIFAGALGAMAGDSIAYWIGRRAERRLERSYFTKESRRSRLDWAKKQIETRGGMLLVTARFIPGGRTAITLASGITKQPYRRFVAFDALAGVLWASYAGGLGYYFGDRFKDDHTRAFLYAFGLALSVTAVIEMSRWVRHRLPGGTPG